MGREKTGSHPLNSQDWIMPPESGRSPSLVVTHHYGEDDEMGVDCDVGKLVPVSESVMDNLCDYIPLSIYNYVYIIILYIKIYGLKADMY